VFRRGKPKGPVANKLHDEAEPNKLTWASAEASTDEAEFEEEPLDDQEFEEEGDEELDEEVDEATLAKRQADLRAELERQAEEYGLTGSNPTAIYGPAGEDVEAILDALTAMDIDQAERLADAWMAVDATERDVLERDLRHSRHGKHEFELTAAEDAVASWLNTQTPADEDEGALWAIVAEAARGAVDALILDEDLDDADYDILYGAWAEVMEADDEGVEGEGATAHDKSEAGDGSSGAGEDEFGPNSELVRQFLAKLGELTTVQMSELTAFWNEQPKAELRQAHKAMQRLAKEDETWRDQVRAAQDQITTWSNGPHLSVGMRADKKLASDRDVRLAAMPPAVDAVSALVLADLLEPEEVDALYTAWEATIGEPKLPEYEDDAQ
jgi:hypothetical protein